MHKLRDFIDVPLFSCSACSRFLCASVGCARSKDFYSISYTHAAPLYNFIDKMKSPDNYTRRDGVIIFYLPLSLCVCDSAGTAAWNIISGGRDNCN